MAEQKDKELGATSDSEDDRTRRKDEIRKKLYARRDGGQSDSDDNERSRRTMPLETATSLEEKLEKAKLARKAMQEDPSAASKVNEDLEKKLQALKESRMKISTQ